MEITELATRQEKIWQHIREDAALREARKQTKKTPKEERVRQRGWTATFAEDPESYYDLDIADRERVMPKGETEARRGTAPVSPLHGGLGLDVRARSDPAQADTVPEQSQGTVVEVSSGLCRVTVGSRLLLCSLRNSLRTPHSGFSNVVAAGDAVLVSHNGHDRGLVEAVLPRRSALARPDSFYPHLQQVIVANVDQVLIVASWREPAFWPELVDRYLIAAARHNLAPTLCINKIDLADDAAELNAVVQAYEQAGCRVILTSAVNETGLAALRETLQGQTTALAGLSGVGKSSLLRAAEPGLNLKVSEVSDRRHEGRHTTTQVSLHPLHGGGFVADTPGIREFGLSGLRRADLARFYPEIAAEAGACTYANCTHTREPGCAVKQAVRTGRMPAMRYDSYRKILRDLPE